MRKKDNCGKKKTVCCRKNRQTICFLTYKLEVIIKSFFKDRVRLYPEIPEIKKADSLTVINILKESTLQERTADISRSANHKRKSRSSPKSSVLIDDFIAPHLLPLCSKDKKIPEKLIMKTQVWEAEVSSIHLKSRGAEK